MYIGKFMKIFLDTQNFFIKDTEENIIIIISPKKTMLYRVKATLHFNVRKENGTKKISL